MGPRTSDLFHHGASQFFKNYRVRNGSMRIFNSFLLRQKSQSALTLAYRELFWMSNIESFSYFSCIIDFRNKIGATCTKREIYACILLLIYEKTTYFALGRISWPFLYHLSSTVGSASSTMNLTLPPLST